MKYFFFIFILFFASISGMEQSSFWIKTTDGKVIELTPEIRRRFKTTWADDQLENSGFSWPKKDPWPADFDSATWERYKEFILADSTGRRRLMAGLDYGQQVALCNTLDMVILPDEKDLKQPELAEACDLFVEKQNKKSGDKLLEIPRFFNFYQLEGALRRALEETPFNSWHTIKKFKDHQHGIEVGAFSPDGNMLAWGVGDIYLWKIKGWDLLRRFTSDAYHIHSLVFSPDGRLLAGGTTEGVRLWRTEDEKWLQKLKGHRGVADVYSVAFSPDGKMLASGSYVHTVCLWDVESGKRVQKLKGHRYPVCSVTFSPDGKILASGSGDGVRLWNVADGECMQELEESLSRVLSVTFSPDGNLLAYGGYPSYEDYNTIKLWDVKNGECVKRLEMYGHAGVSTVAFSPDGSFLVSGGGDARVRVWRTETGEPLHNLKGHCFGPDSAILSPDGKMLASWGEGCSASVRENVLYEKGIAPLSLMLKLVTSKTRIKVKSKNTRRAYAQLPPHIQKMVRRIDSSRPKK